MVFIIAYRLKRKNARRKIFVKLDVINQEIAKRRFKEFVADCGDADKKQYELLTGDWKHIQYYERDS